MGDFAYWRSCTEKSLRLQPAQQAFFLVVYTLEWGNIFLIFNSFIWIFKINSEVLAITFLIKDVISPILDVMIVLPMVFSIMHMLISYVFGVLWPTICSVLFQNNVKKAFFILHKYYKENSNLRINFWRLIMSSIPPLPLCRCSSWSTLSSPSHSL